MSSKRQSLFNFKKDKTDGRILENAIHPLWQNSPSAQTVTFADTPQPAISSARPHLKKKVKKHKRSSSTSATENGYIISVPAPIFTQPDQQQVVPEVRKSKFSLSKNRRSSSMKNFKLETADLIYTEEPSVRTSRSDSDAKKSRRKSLTQSISAVFRSDIEGDTIKKEKGPEKEKKKKENEKEENHSSGSSSSNNTNPSMNVKKVEEKAISAPPLGEDKRETFKSKKNEKKPKHKRTKSLGDSNSKSVQKKENSSPPSSSASSHAEESPSTHNGEQNKEEAGNAAPVLPKEESEPPMAATSNHSESKQEARESLESLPSPKPKKNSPRTKNAEKSRDNLQGSSKKEKKHKSKETQAESSTPPLSEQKEEKEAAPVAAGHGDLPETKKNEEIVKEETVSNKEEIGGRGKGKGKGTPDEGKDESKADPSSLKKSKKLKESKHKEKSDKGEKRKNEHKDHKKQETTVKEEDNHKEAQEKQEKSKGDRHKNEKDSKGGDDAENDKQCQKVERKSSKPLKKSKKNKTEVTDTPAVNNDEKEIKKSARKQSAGDIEKPIKKSKK